jgi:hypothetical protein
MAALVAFDLAGNVQGVTVYTIHSDGSVSALC